MAKVNFGPKGFYPVPSGNYKARVLSITEVDTCYGKSLEVRFQITNGKHKGRDIGKRMKVGRVGDNFWQLVKILSKEEHECGGDLDTETLVGKKCVIHIETELKGKEQKLHTRIKDFQPLPVEEGGQNANA